MKILLTGVAGFIGSHLAERLLSEGHEVLGLDNCITGRLENLSSFESNPNFRFISWDVIKPFPTEETFDWVMHFASPASPPKYLTYPVETLRVNSEGTFHLLELTKRNHGNFFLAGTSEVYGDPLVHPQPESYWGNVNSTGPRSVYDEAKRFAEALTCSYYREFNIPIRIIRIFNTYGPRMEPDDGRVVSNFINQALHNQPLTVYGNGQQTRSFQYVDDLIEGICQLMKMEFFQPLNLGNPEEYTILEFAKMIKELTQSSSIIEFRELPKDDPKQRKPNIHLAKKIMNWAPKISAREGLLRTVEYFQNLTARKEIERNQELAKNAAKKNSAIKSF